MKTSSPAPVRKARWGVPFHPMTDFTSQTSSLPRSVQKTSRGFTLIELLTVIAIIGILAAILIPVVGRVRDSARGAVCMSNLRQVSLALLVFADENDGRLPTAGGLDEGEQPDTDWILWRRSDTEIRASAIVPYLGGSFSPDIYRCPSDENIAEKNPSYRFSYSLNRALGESSNSPRFANFALLNGRVHNVPDHSLIIMMVEEAEPNDSSAWLIASAEDRLTERHGGRGHVSFVDGHVELVYPEFAKYEGHWNPFPGNLRPYDGRR
jgi:prepilin-type N-terminal cleavage/methylation domain-containing protein/prepilin-type processing-associated H-X9-DG protein